MTTSEHRPAEAPPEERHPPVDEVPADGRKRILVIALFLIVSLLITAAAVVLYSMPAAGE